MEVFINEGSKVMQGRTNRALLVYSKKQDEGFQIEKSRIHSALRFRKKTILNIVVLNLLRRRRIVELMIVLINAWLVY
jgi:hypothetical protein